MTRKDLKSLVLETLNETKVAKKNLSEANSEETFQKKYEALQKDYDKLLNAFKALQDAYKKSYKVVEAADALLKKLGM